MGDLGTPLTEIGSPADIEMDHYVEEDEVDGGFSYVRALDRRGGTYSLIVIVFSHRHRYNLDLGL